MCVVYSTFIPNDVAAAASAAAYTYNVIAMNTPLCTCTVYRIAVAEVARTKGGFCSGMRADRFFILRWREFRVFFLPVN